MSSMLCFQAPKVELQSLNNLWFQLSNTTCNLNCRHCYLSCTSSISKAKSFLAIDKIKSAVEFARKEKIENIYLTGGEPLLHPDLNSIIRMSLAVCDVTILTNGILLNNKKTRFLRQVEQNFENELIFRVSLDHYLEHKNDELRGKGSFRKALSGIENLIRNGFNPIISAVNVWNEDTNELKEGFFRLFESIDFEPEDINVKIIPVVKTGEFSKNYSHYADTEIVTNETIKNCNVKSFDCASSRVVTDKGIYACPALVNDPRGKVGNTLDDSANKVFLEMNACYTCQKCNTGLLNNDWSILQ